VSSGPQYARRRVDLAREGGGRAAHRDHGPRLAWQWISHDFRRGSRLRCTRDPAATGRRERPRSAAWCPGSAGWRVHHRIAAATRSPEHQRPAAVAQVVVGAEHVSFCRPDAAQAAPRSWRS
jgi:hypothetical protein